MPPRKPLISDKQKDQKRIVILEPIGPRILVKPVTDVEKTKGGIIVNGDVLKRTPEMGVVVAVGSSLANEHGIIHIPDIFSGDRIMFARNAGFDVRDGGNTYRMIDPADIVCRVNYYSDREYEELMEQQRKNLEQQDADLASGPAETLATAGVDNGKGD